MSQPPFDAIVNNPSDSYTIREFQDDMAKPEPPLKARLIDLGVGLACTIHQNTPLAWLADGIASDGKISAEHMLMDDLCRPRGQNPPPQSRQFDGAQCDGKLYRVFFGLEYIRGLNAPDCGLMGHDNVVERGYVYGTVGAFSLRGFAVLAGDCGSSGYSEIWVNCRGTLATGLQPLGDYKLTGSSANNLKVITGLRLESTDGSALGLCGNPSPKYPPALPSPADLTRTSPLQITPTLNAPVTVTINPTLRVSPTVIAPVLAFNAGGLNVNFGLGGFTFSPTYSPNTTNNFPNTTTPTPTPTPVKSPSKHLADDIDVLEIIKRLDRIGKELEECCERDRPYPPPDANKVITTVLGSANSGLYDLPHDTFQVGLRITDQPLRVKQQDGYNSPDVLYAGWAWFGAANNMSERLPIDSEFKLYSPPRYISNTFGFTLYNGLTAIITAYSIKPKPTPP
jgi:hypothetical protein